LPALPRPCANLSGAVLDEIIYVAGGIAEPDSTIALKTFWSLDLRNLEAGWRELDPWPGPERMFAVAAVDGRSFFLFSGAALKPGKDGKPVREWLRDAYRYTPGSGWSKLPDLPRPTIAAPSPATAIDGQLLVWGGDDGSQVHTAPAAHTGFPRNALAFDPPSNEWHLAAPLPFGLVTTSVVAWNDLLVIPGGEIRPGVRSTEVWALRRN
jgi:N-acetylneuraminic acid mutarotase